MGVVVLLVGSYFLGKEQTPTLTVSTTQQPLATTFPTNPPPPTVVPTVIQDSTTSNASSPTDGGPQNDIVEIQKVAASQNVAQVSDDINFTVTIKNQAPYKKFVQAICFNSTDGNFGCVNGKNLAPGEIFNVNNSTRFHISGTKSVWITWSQDNYNFYRPINGGTAQITIQ